MPALVSRVILRCRTLLDVLHFAGDRGSSTENEHERHQEHSSSHAKGHEAQVEAGGREDQADSHESGRKGKEHWCGCGLGG